MTNDISTLIAENAKLVEAELEKYLISQEDDSLPSVMRYSLLAGGKRIRPFLVIEAFKLFSNNGDIIKALPFACAIEMIHTYSLIHDDLPCMDNDDMRRGRPTCHKVFGEAQALLAGDSLLTYAFDVLASNDNVSSDCIKYAVRALSYYSGHLGMAGGQMIDLSPSSKINCFDDLKKMHMLKTGALIACSVLLGYLAACNKPDKAVIQDLKEYAFDLGVAFQIRDDILDVISSSEKLGKPIGSDEKNEKITSLKYMSLEDAQLMVEELTNKATETISKYSKDGVNSLVDIAKYMVNRDK